MRDEDRWWDDALCRRYDPDMWFPDKESDKQATEAALNICDACPAKRACLDFAMDDLGLDGIWGGTFLKDRRRMFRHGSYSPESLS